MNAPLGYCSLPMSRRLDLAEPINVTGPFTVLFTVFRPQPLT